MSDVRTAPVSRSRVLLATLAGLALMVGLVSLTERLRHPLPGGASVVTEARLPGADPRAELVCDTPLPREGVPRRSEPVTEGNRASTVTSNQLYDCPETYDGTTVSYQGEVVGAVLPRGSGAWVHLNDDPYAELVGPLPAHRDFRGGNAGMGVLISRSLADKITTVGGPKTRGDIVEVTGVFHRVDEATGEVTIIRGQDGSVVRRGGAFADAPLRDRQLAAGVLALVAIAMVLAEGIVAHRR